MKRKLLKAKPAPSLCTSTPQPMPWCEEQGKPYGAVLSHQLLREHQFVCARSWHCPISLPKYCQIIMAFLLQPSVWWDVSALAFHSALILLWMLLTVGLCCPLQSRAPFSFFCPPFTGFSNLLFAAHLCLWRLLIVIDFFIRVFLSYALSLVILWLYWIPSVSFRTFHRLPRQVGTLWIQIFIG